MKDYEKLLERAQKKLPKKVKKKERFEIPKVQGRIEGNKTLIVNFIQIASEFHREPKQILKYLQRELATPGNIDGQRIILGRKLKSEIINQKIRKYAEEFVLCKDCKRPDTQIIKEDRISMIKCTACGSKYPLKAKI